MKLVLLALLTIFAVACVEMDDDTGHLESRTLAQGYTPCNDFPNPESGVICHPNQYCAHQQNNWCHTGCLSNDNCSHDQLCVKNHGNIGECVAIDSMPDPNPVLEPGYTQCGDPAKPKRYAICQPSQYCYSDYFGDCSLGCLSEDNCTENQRCEKPEGENVGVCAAVEDDY